MTQEGLALPFFRSARLYTCSVRAYIYICTRNYVLIELRRSARPPTPLFASSLDRVTFRLSVVLFTALVERDT